mmetsp:Transcript_19332/g.68351  ORF Transcript_19332/g.68351 Transcript_19332/m.68351 type:complete len:287 (-) Transcript_19332:606-1466(-)
MVTARCCTVIAKKSRKPRHADRPPASSTIDAWRTDSMSKHFMACSARSMSPISVSFSHKTLIAPCRASSRHTGGIASIMCSRVRAASSIIMLLWPARIRVTSVCTRASRSMPARARWASLERARRSHSSLSADSLLSSSPSITLCAARARSDAIPPPPAPAPPNMPMTIRSRVLNDRGPSGPRRGAPSPYAAASMAAVPPPGAPPAPAPPTSPDGGDTRSRPRARPRPPPRPRPRLVGGSALAPPASGATTPESAAPDVARERSRRSAGSNRTPTDAASRSIGDSR